jgi:putative transcriptional regulator
MEKSNAIQSGSFLISDPFLKDPHFSRTVVLLCDHSTADGSFGFVMNKIQNVTLADLMNDLDEFTVPVYYGGPVQRETLHFIHRQPELIPGGLEITKGVYWGGNYDTLIEQLKQGNINYSKIRFFQGYSGWGTGQLTEEMEANTWIAHPANEELIFFHQPESLWKEVLKRMGGDYEKMIHYPLDPQLN